MNGLLERVTTRGLGKRRGRHIGTALTESAQCSAIHHHVVITPVFRVSRLEEMEATPFSSPPPPITFPSLLRTQKDRQQVLKECSEKLYSVGRSISLRSKLDLYIGRIRKARRPYVTKVLLRSFSPVNVPISARSRGRRHRAAFHLRARYRMQASIGIPVSPPPPQLLELL